MTEMFSCQHGWVEAIRRNECLLSEKVIVSAADAVPADISP
jgi:hypothetical protein